MCTGIPFPLVSVARLLLQDFWTVMAKDYLALIDPTGNPVPIVRQATLVYLTPTVIPYAVADAARMAASCLPEVMSGIEHELGSVELRGVSDMNDGSIDHLFQIGALIAAAQEVKAKEGYRWDMWEVNESDLKLIRHVRVWRNETLDPRIKLANKSPVPITGKWSRFKIDRRTSDVQAIQGRLDCYCEGLEFPGIEEHQAERPKEWRGRVEFGLRHKPQLRHVQKSAPRPYDPLIGREKSEVVNDEIVEFRKSDDPMEVVEKANVEPEVLDRQMRVSRNVEEHELENALRSLPQHGSRLLPRYWIRMHNEWRDCYFHPDDAPSPVNGLLSDCLWCDRYTMFFNSSDPSQIDAGHQNEWADIEMPDGTVKKCEDPRGPTGRKWIGYCLFRLIDRLLTRMPRSKLTTRVP